MARTLRQAQGRFSGGDVPGVEREGDEAVWGVPDEAARVGEVE